MRAVFSNNRLRNLTGKRTAGKCELTVGLHIGLYATVLIILNRISKNGNVLSDTGSNVVLLYNDRYQCFEQLILMQLHNLEILPLSILMSYCLLTQKHLPVKMTTDKNPYTVCAFHKLVSR